MSRLPTEAAGSADEVRALIAAVQGSDPLAVMVAAVDLTADGRRWSDAATRLVAVRSRVRGQGGPASRPALDEGLARAVRRTEEHRRDLDLARRAVGDLGRALTRARDVATALSAEPVPDEASRVLARQQLHALEVACQAAVRDLNGLFAAPGQTSGSHSSSPSPGPSPNPWASAAAGGAASAGGVPVRDAGAAGPGASAFGPGVGSGVGSGPGVWAHGGYTEGVGAVSTLPMSSPDTSRLCSEVARSGGVDGWWPPQDRQTPTAGADDSWPLPEHQTTTSDHPAAALGSATPVAWGESGSGWRGAEGWDASRALGPAVLPDWLTGRGSGSGSPGSAMSGPPLTATRPEPAGLHPAGLHPAGLEPTSPGSGVLGAVGAAGAVAATRSVRSGAMMPLLPMTPPAASERPRSRTELTERGTADEWLAGEAPGTGW